MRIARFLLPFFALLLGLPSYAETRTPYAEDFDSWSDLSDVSAYGWGVINYNSYVRFTAGVTGNAIDFYWNSSTKEILVTPALTGEVSFQVKTTSSYNNALKLYSCIKSESGTFTQGEEIVLDVVPVLSNSWTTVTIPAEKIPAGTYLGIYGNYVAIDNFTAASAEVVIPAIKRIEIAASSTVSTINCEKGNQYTLPVSVTIRNKGNVDLPQPEDDYTISLLYGQSGNTVIGEPVTIPESIAAGEEKTFTIDFPVDGNAYGGSSYYTYFRVRENALSNVSEYFYVQIKKYSVNYQVKEGTKTIPSGTDVDFGESMTAVSKTYTISNPVGYISGYTNGTGPVIITGVTLPEGFSTTLNVGDEIALGSTMDFDITMDATTPGNKSGVFGIQVDDVAEDFTLNLSGVVIDPNAGLSLISFETPDAGMVNNPLLFSATVKNRVDDMAGVTAELYINGALAQTSSPVDIANGASYTFTFNHVPHAAEDLTVRIKVVGTVGEPVETDERNVTIGAEVASNESEGIGNNNQRSQYVLIYGSYTNTVTDMIYTAAELGLTSGAKITGVTFKGYNSKANTARIVAWMELTDETATTTSVPETPASPNLHNGTYAVPVAGSYADPTAEILKFNMVDPIEYVEGKNIRIVVKSSEVAYISGFTPYFQVDNTVECSAAYEDNADPVALNVVKRRPVLYLSTIKEPTTISGMVKNALTNEGITGVTITLRADDADVVYVGESDAEGKYSIPVIQDTRTYTLSVADVEGYNKYADKENISFANGNVVDYDILLYPATALAIESYDIPAVGTKNHDYYVTVTVKNQLAEDYTNGYTVRLYVDGTVAASQDITETLAAHTADEVSLTYFLTAPGFISVYAELVSGSETCITDVVSVEVADENAGGEVVVGNANDEQISAPVHLWYKASQSETVYAQEKLGDIPAGSLISSISYKGRSAEDYTVNATMQVWMENTADADGSAEGRDVSQMTLVYDGVQNIEPSDSVILTFPLSQPFKYEGGNLRIVVKSVSSDECKTYFTADNSGANSYCRYDETEAGMTSSHYMPTNMAVVCVTYDNAVHMKGKVLNSSDETIEGAIITLTAGNVIYSAVSASDGTYDVTVFQSDKTYSLAATAEGYNEVTIEGVTFTDGSITKDIVFLSDRKFVVGEIATVCLPEYNDEEVAAAGTFYEFDRVEGYTAYFKETTTLTANTPYLFKAAVEVPFHDMADYDTSGGAGAVTRNDVTFQGTYERRHLVSDASTAYFEYDTTGKFVQADPVSDVAIGPFRAYLYTTVAGEVEEFVISLEGIVNDISTEVSSDSQLSTVYTIDGKLLGKDVDTGRLKGGVYIVNGRKTVIK